MSLLLLTLLGCDHTGFAFRPNVSSAPSVSDLGELIPVDVTAWAAGGRVATDFPDGIKYSEIGADANPGKHTGATAHFTGTGGSLCLVVDPEAVFWARSLASSGGGRYKYDDDYTDDGDVDMDAGLTAYYNGSPGVEMGNFAATYTDQTGASHAIDFNACIQSGYGGATNIHAGRATPEYCVVNTDQEAGIDFTIALNTFSLPINDSRLAYAVGVFDLGSATKCDSVFANNVDPECLFTNEANLGQPGGDREGIEQAFCSGAGAVNTYCAAHLADTNPPCKEPASSYDAGTANANDTGGS